MKTIFCALIFMFTVLPLLVSAKVTINEIAWMGTNVSSADEWIELANDSSELVKLDGWTLVAGDGAPIIRLSGEIPGNGFFILERSDDKTLPEISASQIYTGALSNDGEEFVLKDSESLVIDAVNARGGWPAGSNETKETMQFTRTNRGTGAWITGSPTPGTKNSSPPPAETLSRQEEEMQKDSMLADVGSEVSDSFKEKPFIELSKPIGRVKESVYPWLIGGAATGLMIGGGAIAIRKKYIRKSDA